MSDKDSDHMLLELQEARAEIDRLRDLLRWRKWPEEKPEIHGWYITTSGDFFGLNYYHMTGGWQHPQIVWWKAIGETPGGSDG